MIEYSTEKSSFLDRNKLYCENVQSKLAILNYDCSGNCNAYGYNLLSQFERNRLQFHIKFTKYQRTGAGTNNSWWLPSSNIKVSVYEYSGYEFKVTGFNNNKKFAIGKSWIRRIFQSKELNDVLPPPWYIKSNYKLKIQRKEKFLSGWYKIQSKKYIKNLLLICPIYFFVYIILYFNYLINFRNLKLRQLVNFVI